jgi:hypothetical protein
MIPAFLAVFMLAMWIVGAPRLWRGEADVDEPAPAWPFGAPAWRGVIRSFIVGRRASRWCSPAARWRS